MACGWTPDLMRMLEQMAAEKEKLATQSASELHSTTKHIEKLRQKTEVMPTDKTTSDGQYDWTSVYEKWDAWEDPEELAQREQEAREKHERALKSQQQSMCNHDHSAEQKLMDMTTDAKLCACDEFRVLGNLFFAQGQYQRAAYNYHKALVYFEYIFPEGDDENKQHDQLKLTTLLNYCACRLKTGHNDDAIHHADLALELDPHNMKAFYRRAQAHRHRDDFDEALHDITEALRLCDDDQKADTAALLHEKALLHAKMLAYKLKSRQISTAMFAGGIHSTEKKKPTPSAFAPVHDVPLTLSKASMSERRGPKAIVNFESGEPCTDGLVELQQLVESI
ncbi:hypothetical protein Poli38472_012685 [Pythium oligandrum]|uniref:Uncharacterized protein n=1 Tax=Pythium oligandrum TaxID=41045 RepID=A0A8K1CDM7_PYTOL|nr:hypothetical protein Poli38472_012685 [Pythium oligandrum]|eukprot:TMW61494.1 hypothetical protein Poli38472_012685 [Pythium oligandrum]